MLDERPKYFTKYTIPGLLWFLALVGSLQPS